MIFKRRYQSRNVDIEYRRKCILRAHSATIDAPAQLSAHDLIRTGDYFVAINKYVRVQQAYTSRLQYGSVNGAEDSGDRR
jgi:hypothetical protein